MAKTGKGLPRSLQNVDFGDFDIPVTPATTSVVGGVKKSATVAAPAAITAAAITVANLLTALKNAGTVS
ncbi:TPA: hypothetical protein OT587_004612 [Escherichia coli]|nr:hypothetical protein [Escherichia coli]